MDILADVAGLQWDNGNSDKCRSHGVTVATIESLFHGPLAVFSDFLHSETEERFKAIGRISNGRSVLVVFTLRKQENHTFVRPLSARYMHRKEIEYFEKEAARAEKRSGG